MLALTLCAAFDPVSESCDENFEYFIRFYNKTYDDVQPYHDQFCANFAEFLKITDCTTCQITEIFDRAPRSLVSAPARLRQAKAMPKGAFTCQQTYCYAKDPLTRLTQGPPSVDLREWGLVTLAKDQAQCGACWSFGAISILENAALLDQKKTTIETFKKSAVALSLSE